MGKKGIVWVGGAVRGFVVWSTQMDNQELTVIEEKSNALLDMHLTRIQEKRTYLIVNC